MKLDLNKYQAFVFDFDGVLADSVEVKTEAFAKLFEEYGPDIQRKVIAHHRENGGMTRAEKITHYYESFLDKTIDEGTLAGLCARFSNLVVDKVVATPEIPGTRKFLDFWHQRVSMFIDSATPDAEIVHIVECRGMEMYFREILGSGRKKSENLIYILRNHMIEPEKCIFFGDAPSDYEAAIECGVGFVGIVPASDAPLLRHAPHINWFHNFSEVPLTQ